MSGLETEVSVYGPAMRDLPASIRQHAKELRKVRLSQRWSSHAEALEQCKLVEVRAAAVSSGKPKRIFTLEQRPEDRGLRSEVGGALQPSGLTLRLGSLTGWKRGRREV